MKPNLVLHLGTQFYSGLLTIVKESNSDHDVNKTTGFLWMLEVKLRTGV